MTTRGPRPAGTPRTADATDQTSSAASPDDIAQPSNARPRVDARFGHVNVIARDWRALAAFYRDVFGCRPVPPERDYRGADLDAGTGLAGAHLRGVHLRLPGHGDAGPTLEIYSYEPAVDGIAAVVNRAGWGHIAFQVPDVQAARRAVLALGGRAVGEIVTLESADRRRVTWCYVTDPEGNIVELQAWSDS